MSGAVRAGLIFSGIAIVAVLLLSMLTLVIPFGCLCGSLAAAGLGAGAGFYGRRWSPPGAGIGQGILASSIVGIAGLVAGIAFFLIAFSIINTTSPEFREILLEQMQQNPDTQLTQEQLDTLLQIAIPLAGGCFGLINLLLAIAGGAVGGMIAGRGQGAAGPPATPLGPPPMTPTN